MRLLLYWGEALVDIFISLGGYLQQEISLVGIPLGTVGDLVLTGSITILLGWKITKFCVGLS